MSDDERGDTMVEALRRANPVLADGASSRRAQPSAHALLADIIERRPRRVRRRVLLLALVIVVVAATLMAFAVLRRVGTSLSIAPVCYQSDSLQAARVVATGGDPQQACAPLWADGRFGHTVPDFDVCVLPSGVLGVFPGESGSVCSELDLPESSGDNRVERVVDSLIREMSTSCITLDQGEQIAKRELATRSLSNWTVRVDTADPKRPCASVAPDASARTITIVPVANLWPTSLKKP